MAITFRFEVTKVEKAPQLNGLEDVVTRVRYNYIGTDENGNEATFSGATPMPEPTDIENFKPLSELTEEDVITWLEAVADKAHMRYRIEKEISEKLAPKYVDTPLPWATPVEETPTSEI